jgi:YgiT-type zinc finger domain-containing protein
MKCVIRKHGETAPGHATETFERAGSVVVIRNVPAEVRQDCGEHCLDEAASKRVLEQADAAASRKAVIEIVPSAA